MRAKYYVLRIYRTVEPSCVFATDIEQDAKDYARIMSNKNNGCEYAVIEANEIAKFGENE